MKAKHLKLRVINEIEEGKFEIKEFKPYMSYESFVGCILGDSEILRPTGFEDKNCNEIYEGDILEINGHKYFVKFEIGSFMLVRCSDETDMYDQFKNCWNDDVYPLSQFYWDNDCEEDLIYQCEVIGNIYNNPEILNR